MPLLEVTRSKTRALMSWGALALALALPRLAHATSCSAPSGCASVNQVCHLGLCTPCETNYTDGGLDPVLIACQDPSAPICDIPSGSVGGSCVQCTQDSQCQGATCDLNSNTCVDGGTSTGDGGANDGGAHTDAATEAGSVTGDAGGGEGGTSGGDGGASDGAAADGSEGDGGALSGDASGEGDGAAFDATASGGGGGDGSADGGSADDGAYFEGGGCSCNVGSKGAPIGGALVTCLALAGLVARRRKQ
jgi:MYXO-CTERM domain-containing protein